MNPYNCNIPGNLFVGYDELRKDILNLFFNGHSIALMGGRRCGKTSLLIQVENDLKNIKHNFFHILPRRITKHEFSAINPNTLFEKIYSLTVKNVKTVKWNNKDIDKAYESFSEHLNKSHTKLNKRYGPDWLVILLFDELDALKSYLPNDLFFSNLRFLLSRSKFRRHYRLLATGVSGMEELITKGSPLNNLKNKYLSFLSDEAAHKLVEYGFPDKKKNTDFFFSYTGKNPYLMQGILEILFGDRQKNNIWNETSVKKAARLFLKQQNTFPYWVNCFSEAVKSIYRYIATNCDKEISEREIGKNIDKKYQKEIENTCRVLGYHGLIEDFDNDRLKTTGDLFRDWFLKNIPPDTSRDTIVEVVRRLIYPEIPLSEEVATILLENVIGRGSGGFCEKLVRWFYMNRVCFPEPITVANIDNFNDKGIDVLLEGNRTGLKIGFQIKSENDISKKDFSKTLKSQITDKDSINPDVYIIIFACPPSVRNKKKYLYFYNESLLRKRHDLLLVLPENVAWLWKNFIDNNL